MEAHLCTAVRCKTLDTCPPSPTQDPDLGNMIKISHWGMYTKNNSLNASRLILPVGGAACRGVFTASTGSRARCSRIKSRAHA